MSERHQGAGYSFAAARDAARIAWREDAGKLVLRLAVALLILLHGIAKVRHGLGDVLPALARVGLPGALGWLVLVGELLAPALMIVGLWTRAAAWILAATMAVALFLGHPNELFALTRHGSLLLEVQWLFFFGAVAVALLGAGNYSLGRQYGRWN